MAARSPIRAFGLALAAVALVASSAGACTLGVAGGEATADGRPLLWKVRDNEAVPDNEVYYNTALTIPFVAVVTADGGPDSSPWMGANARGFAVVNTDIGDPPAASAKSNGAFMRTALGECRSVDEFLALLAATAGSRDTHANFAVIDSTGVAMIVEVSRENHRVFDTRDSERGFLVRTNFACADTAGVGIDGLLGAERFRRSYDLLNPWADAGDLTVANLAGRLTRDFSDRAGRPLPVPCPGCGDSGDYHGFFSTAFSIGSGHSVAAAVIQGVAAPPAVEPAWLTTLWVQLGQPACTVAVPYWPVGPAPPDADGPGTAPLCDLADDLRRDLVFPAPVDPRFVDSYALRDGGGGGLWSHLLPAEAATVAAVQGRLARWRLAPPAANAVLAFEDSLARAACELLASDDLTEPPSTPAVRLDLAAYPNPFNLGTTFAFALPRGGHARLTIHDPAGRWVARILDGNRTAGAQRVTWQPEKLASGIYLARLEFDGAVGHRRLVLVK